MNSSPSDNRFGKFSSMHNFGEVFIDALPRHLKNLKIPGRLISDGHRRAPITAQIEQVVEIQNSLREVLRHTVTQGAQGFAERAFRAFLEKDQLDVGVLKFFNGWNEVHKTTSLVSAKTIMRLSADAVSISAERQGEYNLILAHMHEVVKDDFGLGHEGHDGMYPYMTAAFGATCWAESQYAVDECDAFSEFLYKVGVAEHRASIASIEHKQSILGAMMVSIASELWNGREYNFIAQYIEEKLISVDVSLSRNLRSLRKAKGYVMAHSGEVENKHGLHALAAAQIFGRLVDLRFDVDQLKNVMLDYNKRAGRAFNALHQALL